MTPHRWARLEEIFLGAVELRGEDRDGFITRVCADHPSLAEDVRRLLADHDRAGDFIEPLPPPLVSDAPVAGRRLGAYTLVRVLASGGMGTVYEAQQDSPRRSVALKVLRAGLASPGLLRRFREESAILARLQHPGIAQVYEAGTTDDAGGPVPFFAMELVEGARSITAFAIEQQLPRAQSLALFLTVCDAVQHAHHKGVIHRDLKPGNILIDGDGNPKVIDFGVARALKTQGAATALTDARTLVGTVAYMSPEQCDPSSDADVRSDVYSLGVVLYELLCARLPYAVDDLPLSEATRLIREQPPRRLSAVLPALRGDLETIALKALEKDRDRRYQSVADLGADLRRFLVHQPISARPPTLAYHALRLVARNKLASALALGALLGGIAFAVSVTVLYTRADAARLRAQAAERDALDQQSRSRAAGRELIAMLQGLDPDLSIASAERAEEASQTPLEILDRCSQSLGHMLAADPALHAEALMALSSQYARFRAFERAYRAGMEALELRRRELGSRHAAVAEVQSALAPLADRIATPGEAEALSRDSVAGFEASLPDRAANLVLALEQLAGLYRRHGDLARALEARQRGYDLARRYFGPDDPRTADAGVRLAGTLPEDAKAEADRLLTDALGVHASAFGEDDPRTLRTTAALLRLRADDAGWERVSRRLVDLRIAARGPDHPEVADELLALVGGLSTQGRFDACAGPVQEALRIRQRVFGERSLRTAQVHSVLGTLGFMTGDFEKGERHVRECLSINRAILGEDHVDTAAQALMLATILSARRDSPDSGDLLAYASGHYTRTRRLDAGHPLHSGGPLLLGMVILQRGQYADAEPLLREAVDARRATFTPNHAMTIYAEGLLAVCRSRLGDCREAPVALASAHDSLAAMLGPRHLRSIELLRRLVDVYDSCGPPETARRWRESLERLLPNPVRQP